MYRVLVVLFLGCLAVPSNLNAQDAAGYNARGIAWHEKGNYDMAIANYNQALAIEPNHPEVYAIYDNRGQAWYDKGEYDKAIADHNQALAVNPSFGKAYHHRGMSWDAKGEYDKAIADYNQALVLDPNAAVTYNNRGFSWKNKSEYDKAIADFNQALLLNPKYGNAYWNRGHAWDAKGEYDKAIADFNQALAINPNDADFYNSLGWLYATCSDAKYRDGKKAFENANKAYQLSGGKDWGKIDTLAAAYAESGDFEHAKEWEAKAIEMVKTDKTASDKDKADAASRLESYKQRKPWREELKKK